VKVQSGLNCENLGKRLKTNMNPLFKPIDELAARGTIGMSTALGSSVFSRFVETSQPFIAWIASVVGLCVGVVTLIYVIQGVILRGRTISSRKLDARED